MQVCQTRGLEREPQLRPGSSQIAEVTPGLHGESLKVAQSGAVDTVCQLPEALATVETTMEVPVRRWTDLDLLCLCSWSQYFDRRQDRREYKRPTRLATNRVRWAFEGCLSKVDFVWL